jgi:hypothetical protein
MIREMNVKFRSRSGLKGLRRGISEQGDGNFPMFPMDWRRRTRPRSSPYETPKIRHRDRYWTLSLRKLPMSAGVNLASMYGLRLLLSDANMSFNGTIRSSGFKIPRLHRSHQHVASRRLREGDFVGTSLKRPWKPRGQQVFSRVLQRKDPRAKTDHRGYLGKEDLQMRNGMSLHRKHGAWCRPRETPTKWPVLRTHYDLYHRLGSVSRVSMTLNWSYSRKSRRKRRNDERGEWMSRQCQFMDR